MTASAYDCSYIFDMFSDLYQMYDGDLDFLNNGFESLDPKIKKVWDLIFLLKEKHTTKFLNS